MPSAPAELFAAGLRAALSDFIDLMPNYNGRAIRERLANRLNERSALPGGAKAAIMLGAFAAALINLEV